MTAPICPIHGTPMRESARGGIYYCPRPGDGPKGYCTQKAGAKQSQPSPTHVSQSPTVQEYSKPLAGLERGHDTRVAAALNFAGRIYQGQANNDANTAEVEKLALNLAERALLMFERKP